MAPLNKFLRGCAWFIELFLAVSLFYIMLRRNPGSLPQERVVFKQILKTGNMLFNMFKPQLFLPAANEVWSKVIFLQASVCPLGGCGRHPQVDTSLGRYPLLSVHRGWHPPLDRHLQAYTSRQKPPWADTLLPRQIPPADTAPGKTTTPPRQPLNRVVHILLECILVM